MIILMCLSKLMFSELEYRNAIQNNNINWFLRQQKEFKLIKPNGIILMCLFIYTLMSGQKILSLLWFAELAAFVATGVIGDIISQYAGYRYLQYRAGSQITKYREYLPEIRRASQEAADSQEEAIDYQPNTFDVKQKIKDYANDYTHLAILSTDGGKFVSTIDYLPPITYVVENFTDKAEAELKGRELKITSYTKEGRLPFKNEKIDVLVNQLANYDKHEIKRVLKPGGYAIINQVGSDNFPEILRFFLPFNLKGTWDKANCIATLESAGFEVVDGYEEFGHIRFMSLASLFKFMNKLSLTSYDNYDNQLGFFADALDQIKGKKFFELTTHQFMVIVKKI